MDLKANTGTVLKWLTYHCPVTTSTQFDLAFIKQKPRQRKALVYYCCASTVFPEVFSSFRFHVDVSYLPLRGTAWFFSMEFQQCTQLSSLSTVHCIIFLHVCNYRQGHMILLIQAVDIQPGVLRCVYSRSQSCFELGTLTKQVHV